MLEAVQFILIPFRHAPDFRALPYNRKVRTFELNILVLVRILYWLLFQILANLLNNDLAFPTLAVIYMGLINKVNMVCLSPVGYGV